MYKIALIFACSVWYSSIWGQEESCDESCHCMQNLTPAGVMISHVHPKNEWMFSYRMMQMNMGNVVANGRQVSSTEIFTNYLMYSASMRMQMHMLMGMYGLSNRHTLMAMLNVQQNQMEMKMIGNHVHDGSSMSANEAMKMRTFGLSDAKVYWLYAPVKKVNRQLVVSGGVSLPLGSIQLSGKATDLMYPNQRYPYMMQLGSGTLDVLPGITYTHQQEKWAASFQSTAILRLGANANGYRYGNEISLSTWFAYSLWDNLSLSVRFEGNQSGQIIGFDAELYKYNEIAANPMNYGGMKAITYGGLNVNLDKLISGLTIQAEYGFPVYQQLNGFQNKLNQQFFTAINFKF